MSGSIRDAMDNLGNAILGASEDELRRERSALTDALRFYDGGDQWAALWREVVTVLDRELTRRAGK